MHHQRKFLSALFLVLSFSLQIRAEELRCEYIPLIVRTMVKQHFLHNDFNANLESRSIDQFIKGLDPAKIYFEDADVKKVKTLMKGFYEKIGQKKCKTLIEVRELFLKRVEERTKFAEKYLGPQFKLDPTTEIQLSSDKREYPKKSKEAEDFQKKYLQWQVANFIATDMKLDEAKQQIIRRYQRALKNLKEQKPDESHSAYLEAVAHSLDPHSDYLSQDSLEDFEIQMRLSLEGIGATLSNQDGYTVIEQLIPGGAAQQSGLLENQDKITAVGQDEDGAMEPIYDMPLRDVVKMIRGPKGKKVQLSILRKRGDKSEKFKVTLTRQKINLEQEAAQIYYLEKEIAGQKKTVGVINLPSFYSDARRGGRSCYEDVKKLLAEAAQKKVSGVMLDLSSNGGGVLDDAVKLAGLFFKTGNVVKTQGIQSAVETLADKDEAVNYAGPLVVLTSRLSASASEIVAGALQDYKRAVIVGGDHTFGKGSVQQVVPLPNNLGAFKVTVGMFFVPGGNSTQHRGVSADVALPGAFSTDEVGEKSLDYSLPPRSIKAFTSESAQGTGENKWMSISESMVKQLRKNSQVRVKANAEFQKIVKEMKETETRMKTMKVADVIKKKDEITAKEEKRKKEASDIKLRQEEYLKRPDIQESIAVLTDLIKLEKPN